MYRFSTVLGQRRAVAPTSRSIELNLQLGQLILRPQVKERSRVLFENLLVLREKVAGERAAEFTSEEQAEMRDGTSYTSWERADANITPASAAAGFIACYVMSHALSNTPPPQNGSKPVFERDFVSDYVVKLTCVKREHYPSSKEVMFVSFVTNEASKKQLHPLSVLFDYHTRLVATELWINQTNDPRPGRRSITFDVTRSEIVCTDRIGGEERERKVLQWPRNTNFTEVVLREISTNLPPPLQEIEQGIFA